MYWPVGCDSLFREKKSILPSLDAGVLNGSWVDFLVTFPEVLVYLCSDDKPNPPTSVVCNLCLVSFAACENGDKICDIDNVSVEMTLVLVSFSFLLIISDDIVVVFGRTLF